MTKHSGEWNIYLKHKLSGELAVVHNWDDYFRLTEGQGYVKIGRAQWRQLKREQREANNVSKMMIQDAKDSGLNP